MQLALVTGSGACAVIHAHARGLSTLRDGVDAYWRNRLAAL